METAMPTIEILALAMVGERGWISDEQARAEAEEVERMS
jgi:hypothetical protein